MLQAAYNMPFGARLRSNQVNCFGVRSVMMNVLSDGGNEVSETVRRVSEHPMKTSFDCILSFSLMWPT